MRLQVHLIEMFGILGLFVVLFMYNAIATDLIIVFYSFGIYLLFLLPFLYIMNLLKTILYSLNLQNLLFFNSLFYFSTMIYVFVGMYLFTMLVYLCFFA